MHPKGQLRSLGLLDALDFLHHHLTTMGLEVTVAKNRLAGDAVNFVLGAHLGFEADWLDQFSCVLVNLEQVDEEAGQITTAYRELLRGATVLDFHPDGAVVHSPEEASRHVVSLGHVPRLDLPAAPLAQRPIDLVFLGEMSPRRAEAIRAVEALGQPVLVPGRPLYGKDRDELVRQSRAVLTIGRHASAHVEQSRVATSLSCGTPVVSEKRSWDTWSEQRYGPYVHGLELTDLSSFFSSYFGSAAFFADADGKLDQWRLDQDDTEVWVVLAKLLEVQYSRARGLRPGPSSILLDVGEGEYRPGWLNIGSPGGVPDVVHDFTAGAALPLDASSRRWPGFVLRPGTVDVVDIGPVTARTSTVATRLNFALAVLGEGGRAIVRWPVGRDTTELEDVSDRFWRSGATDHRFTLTRNDLVDASGAPCTAAEATHIRVVLRKDALQPGLRTDALAASEDLSAARLVY